MRDIWCSLCKQNYIGKKVYIWNFNYDSLCILIMALDVGIYIEGFVGESLYDEVILNKRIYHMKSLPQNAIVLYSELSNEWIIEVEKNKKVFFEKVGIHQLRSQIIQNTTIIYGAGETGKRVLKKLKKNHVPVKGFLDSNRDKIGHLVEGYFVYDIGQIEKTDVIIIANRSYKEVYYNLSVKGFQNVFIDYESIFHINYPYIVMDFPDVDECAAIWSLQWHFFIFMRDVLEKQIILYEYNKYSSRIEDIFKLLDLSVKYYTTKESGKDYLNQKFIENLSSADMDNKIILNTNFYTNEQIQLKCKGMLELEQFGFKNLVQFRDAVTMSDNTIRDNNIDQQNGYFLDPMLGYTLKYPETSLKYNQYVVFGHENAAIRILILGNSTSDAAEYMGETKSWAEYLYEIFKNHGINVMIFVGAIGGYNVRQETLKLFRDIGTIHPTLVVSYSGINDTYIRGGGMHPFLFPFQAPYKLDGQKNRYDLGVRSEEDVGTVWLRCEDTMNCIAQISSSKFMGIFQPTIYNKCELIKRERLVPLFCLNQYGAFEPDWKQLVLEYNALLKVIRKNKREFIYDFSDLFATSKFEIFKDNCHLYDLGNRIVAEKIYDIIQQVNG